MNSPLVNLRLSAYMHRAKLLRRCGIDDMNKAQRLFAGQDVHILTPDGANFKFQNRTFDQGNSKQGFLVTASEERTICGFAYFTVFPISIPGIENTQVKIADLSIKPDNFSGNASLPHTLSKTPDAIFVEGYYGARFFGIGRTLLSFCLLHSLDLGLPYFQVRGDTSMLTHSSYRSFYESLGFIKGNQANDLLRPMGDFFHHDQADNICYLNGILENDVDFEIPAIRIKDDK